MTDIDSAAKKIAITVRFSDKDLLNEVKRMARAQRRSVSAQIEHMLAYLVHGSIITAGGDYQYTTNDTIDLTEKEQ